jgi:hypothetical protein
MFLQNNRILVYEFSTCLIKDALGFLECDRNWLLCRFMSMVKLNLELLKYSAIALPIGSPTALNYLKKGVESTPKTSCSKIWNMDNIQHKVYIMNSSWEWTLMMKPQISDPFVINSILTWLIARGYFNKFIRRENLKYYIIGPPLLQTWRETRPRDVPMGILFAVSHVTLAHICTWDWESVRWDLWALLSLSCDCHAKKFLVNV